MNLNFVWFVFKDQVYHLVICYDLSNIKKVIYDLI